MGKIFFTSDLHFCHDREFVWKDRGFSSVEEMCEAIVRNWNNVVGADDQVYVLGDVALGGDSGTEGGVSYLSRLNGRITLIAGNHDTDRRLAAYGSLPNVERIAYADRIRIGKRVFFLCHYPTMTGNMEANPGQVVINLHGHTHSKDRFYNDIPYMYNVGLDAHGMVPVGVDEVLCDFERKVEECLSQC